MTVNVYQKNSNAYWDDISLPETRDPKTLAPRFKLHRNRKRQTYGSVLLARLQWYVNPRYWKQAVASAIIYASMFMIWDYLLR